MSCVNGKTKNQAITNDLMSCRIGSLTVYVVTCKEDDVIACWNNVYEE